MRRFVVLLAAAAALLSAETKAERGKRIADEALAALGGQNFLDMKDRIESGRAYSFYRERLTGLALAKIYTRYLTPQPNALTVRERESFGKNEDSVVLFLEKEAYQLTYRGAKPIVGDRLVRYRESTLRNVLYIFHQRLQEPGLTFESQGSDIFANTPVEVVDIIDAENRTTTVYFHRRTKLPVRQVFYRRDPETKERIEEVTLFTKFRDVGNGVQWPFNILRERNGEKIFEIFSDSVVINQNLTDELFTLPANTKMLKPEK
ncbi:MAG TPA: hypothetical protein VMZ52_08060 [Bryobacteraceae bacterium]|nr:hypothetical protein [Bryobacteraceae bacterium]